MANEINMELINLIDSAQDKHPEIGHDQRIYLAQIARGYRLMRKYSGGTLGTPLAMTDEWICGNAVYGDACNALQKIVGVKEEEAITQSIRSLIDEQALD